MWRRLRKVARTIELAGVSLVAPGSFNPSIFHPLWFGEKALIPEGAVEDALSKEFVSVREFVGFEADWLTVQVTLDKAVLSTVDEGRDVDLRDVALSVFRLLPETPVNAIGINADVHFRVESEAEWHAIGDHFLPKDFWEPVFVGEEWARRDEGTAVGMRSLSVEAHRSDLPALVRIEVAPSVRTQPHLGVYVGVNAHFQLSTEEVRGTAEAAAAIIEEHWEATRQLEHDLVGRILEMA